MHSQYSRPISNQVRTACSARRSEESKRCFYHPKIMRRREGGKEKRPPLETNKLRQRSRRTCDCSLRSLVISSRGAFCTTGTDAHFVVTILIASGQASKIRDADNRLPANWLNHQPHETVASRWLGRSPMTILLSYLGFIMYLELIMFIILWLILLLCVEASLILYPKTMHHQTKENNKTSTF